MAATCAGRRDGLFYFFRPDLEFRQLVFTECKDQGNIRGIATAGDENTGNPGRVVARVEHPPLSLQIDLHPGREIPRRMWLRLADIAEIAGAVACRDIHAAAEGDCQMREITANPMSLGKGLGCGAGRARVFVSEADMAMHEGANGLYPRPARLGIPEQPPGFLGQEIGVAVAASKKKDDRFRGQLFDKMLFQAR